ncbi:MAG TPA: LLM class F420-dependent oxidoreductase [Acidimicrobiales bacterium]|nr:LLM class F420-dependent oxidoreductase [Acidimicrobiales bacterium]
MTDGSPPPPLRLAPIGIWTAALDVVGASEAQELAVEIESLGYGAVWLPEVAGRDVFLHLGLLLSATRTLVGATGIANIWGRDAVTMTGAVKGLAEAFPERALIGLGVSHKNLVEGLRGHDYDKPLSAMRAYLERMDASPYTARRPTTPMRRVLAALGPKMLQLAAERTDGAHPYFVPPEHTATARGMLGDGPLLCPEQAVLLETDAERARTIGRAHTAIYVAQPNYTNNLRRLGFTDGDFADGGSDRLVDAIVAWGTVDDVVARVQAHLDAGADHVCVQALTPSFREVPIAQWRELAPALVGLSADR